MLFKNCPHWFTIFWTAVALTVLGCGSSEKLVPVTGKVTIGDQPLTAGLVMFHPDASKGNKSPVGPLGPIGSNGNYELMTNGKKGAPPGWYRVCLSAGMPSPADFAKTPTPQPTAIHPKYTDPQKSALALEVVEKPPPGAYDLKLAK